MVHSTLKGICTNVPGLEAFFLVQKYVSYLKLCIIFVFYRQKVPVQQYSAVKKHILLPNCFSELSLLTFRLTSAPFCLAEQWLMFSVPDIKSFWTSTTRNMLTGRTICKRINKMHSYTLEETLFLLWD